MFKNELIPSQTYNLSKKEKKDLLKKLGIFYNSDCIKYINDNFNGIFSSHKVTIGSNKRRIIIYDNNPIFFEYDNDTFYPTVYLLNQFPEMLQKIAVIYQETDSYLDNGADLMLKGVLNKEDIKKNVPFKLNDVFIVVTTKGIITSIGQALMSTMTMNINQPSGKFMKILHRINDSMFLMGTKKFPERIILNPIVTKVPEVVKVENNTINNTEKEIIDDNTNTMIKNFEEKIEINGEEAFEEQEQEEFEENEEFEEIEENELAAEEINVNANLALKEEEIKIPKLSLEENDKNIELIFLYLVKLYLLENKEILPLDPGKLFKTFMIPCSEELKLPFEMKSSSYKKINNYLKFLQKEKNLVTFGKPKGLQNDCLLSITWDHPMITDFVPRTKVLKFILKLDEDNDEKENILLSKDEKIDVTTLYKPNQKLKIFFEKGDKEFSNSKYYPIKKCNEILTTYLKEHDLLLKEGNVRIDAELKSALFKYDKEANSNITETLKVDELLQKWKKNLNEKNFITKTGANNDHTIMTNNGVKVRIHAKKLNNKNVTIIDGLQNFVNVKDVIKIFSKHFACSVTIKDFQSSKDAVFIQGYWVSELVTLLQDELKLKKELIIVEDKLNLKTKKKK